MRRQRLRRFTHLLTQFNEPVRVLDVGGAPGFWQQVRAELPRLELTLLNLTPMDGGSHADTRAVIGDARDMSQFEAASFDVCFSNSVIEHVGSFADQAAMAREIQRVGRCYFVQTPYKYFPIEAHYHVPAWQFLPVELRVRLHQHFDLGWMKRQPQVDQARRDVVTVRLLAIREYRMLFPQAQLHFEWIGPLIKSMIAVGGAQHTV
jgi:hypothetical protein